MKEQDFESSASANSAKGPGNFRANDRGRPRVPGDDTAFGSHDNGGPVRRAECDGFSVVTRPVILPGMAIVVRGPVLVPRPDRTVELITDGVLAGDDRVDFVGSVDAFRAAHGGYRLPPAVDGVICPPMLDLHTHLPQHPIRGHFDDGVAAGERGDDDAGRLLLSLQRNVFPAEEKFADLGRARQITDAFVADTLANGVIGGSLFLTVNAEAAFDTMARLHPLWHGGMVLMDRHCPPGLRSGPYVQSDLRNLAESLGRRLVVTDRFAIATSSALRQYGASIAREFDLMTQTHLNEQLAEKRLVEEELYADAESYTHVYLRDGLLDTRAILAHCLHMTPPEWAILQSRRAVVAHCPTSNALLGSGVMDLDEVIARGLDCALCTDVGASPTVSLLAEMAMFLFVHRGRSAYATACEALWRTTYAPAQVLGDRDATGGFTIDGPMSFAVFDLDATPAGKTSASAEALIADRLLRGQACRAIEPNPEAVADLITGRPGRDSLAAFHTYAGGLTRLLSGRCQRVVVAGETLFARSR